VAACVRRRLRGACEQELSGLASLIHRPSDGVPDAGFDLPFVDQPRSGAVQHKSGIQACQLGSRLVDIKTYFAGRVLPSRFCLAACLGPLQGDRAHDGEIGLDLVVYDAGQVRPFGHGGFSIDVAGRL